MTAATVPTNLHFLYPISRQFPFDEVCERIVRELETRNWQVPGLDVEFHEYGIGDQKLRAVWKIRTEDFRLLFNRIQRTLPGGRYNDTAAVGRLVIPKKELWIYGDESGPTYYTYVGTNWKRDREKFMDGSKVNSKLYKEPRTYLQYHGKCFCPGLEGNVTFSSSVLLASMFGQSIENERFKGIPHNHPGRRPPFLVHNNDLGREYEPRRGKWNFLKWKREPDEPVAFNTEEVFGEFRQYLEQVVLAKILAHPIASEK